MINLVFDVHNTICYQGFSSDFFIDISYKELLAKYSGKISYSMFREVWLGLDKQYLDMTQKGFEALTIRDTYATENYLVEVPYIEKVRLLFSLLGLHETGHLARLINDHFQKYWISGLYLYPFTISVLEELRQYNLGIVSNFRDAKWLYFWLQKQKLLDYFHDNIVISEIAGYRKPNPILFKEILSLMDVKDGDWTFYIGDNEMEDRLGASLVGIKPLTLGIEIGSIDDLPFYLKNYYNNGMW